MNKLKINLLLGLAFFASAAIPNPPDLGVGSYVLYEPTTKKVLVSFNADEPVQPASLTKLMTSYVVADYIKEDFISLDDAPKISIKAWKTEGSRMFIREGKKVPVSELIKGMIIQSGNDASVALAEHVAGSEENFAYLMNGYATELGMENTSFNNATGLPDPLNVTSAFDLALLTSALINEFPEHYKLYSEKTYTYAGIKQPNRNRLLWRSDIFDGAKTGYHSQAGYCLVGSAIRGDMRLVAVVLGSENDKRFNDVSALMDYGYRYFITEKLFSESEAIKDLQVVAGVSDSVSIGLKEDIILTLQKNKRDNLSFEVSAGSQILAPINAFDKAGTLKVIDDENNVIVETDLVYLDSVEELGFFQRLIAILWNWIKSLFN
ncbi:MAG: D-alanyl-D-alanine carboxypeptidase family protein [Gammaproteobacteria bacterium]|uniref:serine-type D-Ala-D-Ala carboxypeptidase n=1 Tax=SAR86 cluster bacterium TaxID=2030880 RepID=A0A520MRD3_9GAMM|nr:MAG: D-alanyl-D-alanine carboxypeptidase [SAR86 cluster bacterium]